MAKLTKKQEKFIDEYMIDLNATRAYIAAFGECKNNHSARSCASELLSKPDVQDALDKRLEEMRMQYKGVRELIIQRNINIITQDIPKIVKVKKVNIDGMLMPVVDIAETDTLTDEQRQCIKSITQTRDGIKIEFEDKAKAEERLIQLIGLDREKNVDIGIDTSAISHLSTEELIAALNSKEDDE